MLEIYNERYTPENSTLVIVGGIEYKETLELVKKHFEGWEDRETIGKESGVNKETGIYLNTQSGGENSIISVAFKTPSFNNAYRNYIEVMSLIMGESGLKSRLAKKIRVEKGLAYVINSFENFYEKRGILGFASVCAHSTVNKIASIMMKEFEKSKKFGFTEYETEGAKNKLITKRILGLENVGDHLKFLGKSACYNSNFSLEQEIRNINKINAKTLQEIANEIFSESNMALAAVGDFDVDNLLEVIELN